MTPADAGRMAVRMDQAVADARTQTQMWLVTRPTADSELADVLWACSWTDLGNAFKGGLEGWEVVGLYASRPTALKVAKALLAVRDGARVPATERA